MNIIMVCGPPAAGKSSYVAARRTAADCQVDMDLIPRHHPQPVRRAMRKALLNRAASATASPHTCWFQTTAPTRKNRDYWRDYAPIAETIILAPSFAVAHARLLERDGPEPGLLPFLVQWYKRFELPTADEPRTHLIDNA